MHLFAEPEVWVLLAVVAFVIGVWKPARRVILGGLDARAARIRDELQSARRLREEAQQALAAYQKRQREAGQRDQFADQSDATHTLEQISDPAGFDLESIWDVEWEKNILSAALERVKRQVDAEQVQIFDLYCLEQWPAKKVANTLGVSVGGVYLAKHRIGRLLKKEIKRLESGQ